MAESWAWLVNQFEQTFITDNRWQYFAKGIVTTLEVTFLALILGVVIGCGHRGDTLGTRFTAGQQKGNRSCDTGLF